MNPVPLSLAEELHQGFDDFQNTVQTWDQIDRALFSDLHARAMDLSKTNLEAGNLILAKLGSLVGDDTEVERWCRNLELNHHLDTALHMRFHHYVNMGRATAGQDLLPKVIARRSDQNLLHLMHGAIALGAFTTANKTLEEALMRNEVLVGSAFIETIKSSAKVIAELGIEDSHIAKMFDEAGDILREARRNWASYALSIVALPSTRGGPAVSVEWPLSVSPAEAAQLTWELTGRLVDKDLDRPGFSLGFLGVKLQ
ncbi:hypothetical protein LJR066_005703 [Acidovorax sp. LjRoot66]|uniref:hypothetical protein n=1 Tax=Acidovorax sp. LjRoot66 TaxID=3342334 RepID=UPI003ED09C23